MKISKITNKIRNIFSINLFRNNKQITYMEAKELLKQNAKTILLDVRSIQEYNEYHLTGAICIPVYELQQRIQKVVPNCNTTIISYCQTGHRSEKAIHILEKMGYTNLYQIEGGIDNL